MQAACAFSNLTARVRHASARIRFMMLQLDQSELLLRNMELKSTKRTSARDFLQTSRYMW